MVRGLAPRISPISRFVLPLVIHNKTSDSLIVKFKSVYNRLASSGTSVSIVVNIGVISLSSNMTFNSLSGAFKLRLMPLLGCVENHCFNSKGSLSFNY